MTENDKTPEGAAQNGTVADSAGNWVDHRAPKAMQGFLRLSRADRPIGTWLLYIPCLWALALASLATDTFNGFSLWIIIGCGIGAFLMRGAGCTWNDITDREIDAKVARTRSRPIPSGQVSLRGALIWMVLQALVSLLILLSFPTTAILLGFLSVIPVAIYPFAKRFTWWPQVFLGLAFNWGALLVWAAQAGNLGWPAVILYAGGISWTLFYDTIYAHQDTEDDALIGVKSTARLFGDHTARWLRYFLTGTVLMLGLAVVMATLDRSFLSLVIALCGPWAMGWHLLWQLGRFNPDDTAILLKLFRSNRDAGLIPLPFFAVAFFL